jgi:hypothetical protein
MFMRYDSVINRQFYQAMHQLEQLQRFRRSEKVPTAVNAHISHPIATASDDKSQAINHSCQTNPRGSLFPMFGFQAGGISGADTPGREKCQFVKSKLPN